MKTGALASVLLFALACGSGNSHVESSQFPNESSELAVLMRAMFDDAMRMKEAVQNGAPVKTELDLSSIKTAQGTEPDKVASTAYQVFADSYLHVTEQFLNATDRGSVSGYLEMVEACEQCHRSLCPGPLVRIEKLKRGMLNVD